MASAGFYTIHNSEIRFAADGYWYADGKRIENRRIAALFSRSVERDPDGGYRLRVADEVAPIIVDDTAYVVTGVTLAARIELTLNDGSCEPLVEDSLEISSEHVFYCMVKGASEPARFLRAAHYQLADLIHERADGSFELRIENRAIAIRTR